MIDPSTEPGLVALVTHARSVHSEEREAFGDAATAVAGSSVGADSTACGAAFVRSMPIVPSQRRRLR